MEDHMATKKKKTAKRKNTKKSTLPEHLTLVSNPEVAKAIIDARAK
jgi:hypothetical protein